MEELTSVKVSVLKFDERTGLIPVVTQEINTKEVLMLAYADRVAVDKTLTTGFAYYWSRERKSLWMKGESSGNTQKIKRVLTDCDYDALLYLVEQKGVACHTGKMSCFHHSLL